MQNIESYSELCSFVALLFIEEGLGKH
jgi:hypothetical protein